MRNGYKAVAIIQITDGKLYKGKSHKDGKEESLQW